MSLDFVQAKCRGTQLSYTTLAEIGEPAVLRRLTVGYEVMKDYVVYHNPDSIGYPATEIEGFSVLTNNRIGDIRGDRVWLLTGEGKPRKYSLVFWFIVDGVASAAGRGFKYRVSGSEGKVFDPMIPLDSEAEWFQAFKKHQGGFAFGFRPIKERKTVEKLELLSVGEIADVPVIR